MLIYLLSMLVVVWRGQKQESLRFVYCDILFYFIFLCIQVELVLSQFRRAKGRADATDVELYEDLACLYNKSPDADTDPAVLRRLAEKLQLMQIDDLTQESLALHEMVTAKGADPGESIEKMSMLLKKIKDFVQTENPNLTSSTQGKSLPSSCSGQISNDGNNKSLVIPDDFRCPISLELMKDPVIVSTGQVCTSLVSCSVLAELNKLSSFLVIAKPGEAVVSFSFLIFISGIRNQSSSLNF